MIYPNVTIEDVKTYGLQRDVCVVLPTLDHAVFWWSRIILMMEDAQPNILRTKTALVLRRTQTAIRLWVPYELEPTQPFDHRGEWIYQFDYLLLYGLYRGRLKWQ